MNLQEELDSAQSKQIKTTCCQSYKLPKGRCYDCVEQKRDEER